MFTFRGDAHKVYLKLKKTPVEKRSMDYMAELAEIEEIRNLYRSIDSTTLKLIFYRIIKEKNGSGIIPILVSSIPWFLFLFSNKIQDILTRNGSILWIIFGVLYIITITVSVVLHFHEKAWAAIHIEVIQDILEERDDE